MIFIYIYYNPNPTGRAVGDCAVRAVAKALNIDWETSYCLISANGFLMGDMPSSNSVWGSVLRENGFTRSVIENDCADCYTAENFSNDNNTGVFVLGFGTHTATGLTATFMTVGIPRKKSHNIIGTERID